jgi:hypothetical protein
MLKEIADILVEEGYPKFILTEDVLDEKARKKKEKDEAVAAGTKYVEKKDAKKVCGSAERAAKFTRSFENANRACALKNIILRWMDTMVAGRSASPDGGAAGGRVGLRYFYRPIAAAKTGHKGTVTKA